MEEKRMEIKVGIIGYGLSGSVFHAPLIEAADGLRLQAIVSSQATKVHKDYPNVDVFPDVDALLSNGEIDAVIVTTPNTTHYEFAKKAIMAGKHVVVEKPFTNTTKEADELIALAKEKGVLLTVYQNRRWDNDFLTIRRLLESKVLGELSTYEAHYDRFRPAVQDRWREQDLPGSGILYDLGAHLIDQALTLFGMPKTIWADLRCERAGAKATDYFHLVLGYDQMRAILHSSSLVCEPGPRYLLHGNKGSFLKTGLDPQEGQLKKGRRPGDVGWGEDCPENFGKMTANLNGLLLKSTIQTLPGSYQSFYEGLYEAIEFEKEVPVFAEEARDVIRIIELAIKSHHEQRIIQVENEI
jgi:scyllo-inositol 2-dehydrogenase (NADP+)